MSPETIVEEFDSLEQETNKALAVLTETVNLNASITDSLSDRIDHIDNRLTKIEEQDTGVRELIDSFEKTLGDLTRRIKALELPAPAPEFKRLYDLEVKARTLGSQWCLVEIYERPDGSLIIDRFIAQRSMIEQRLENKQLDPPKVSKNTDPC